MNNRYYDARHAKPDRPVAAALFYDPLGTEAPEIVATGRGIVAEEIVRVARANNVPLREDPGLVEALSRLEIGRVIPRELYAVVAEVLAFVYAVDAESQRAR